jgi:lipopolysaccharide transport system ATP-binding protein
MSSERGLVVAAANVSKRYRIGAEPSGGGVRRRFADVLRAARSPLRAFTEASAPGMRGDILWALRDVSFEVRAGEVLGIVGRNGAGKSTLLKILSRITRPTTGRIDMYGRISSLLEVGTGFNPELSGRDNVFLNGAILGMKRQEIARKLDEIVAFAEVDRFLHTPVKFYSSGMYVRLAFAVAAHLETEVLVVDEVLAVGDVAFQRKCLQKLGTAAGEGRTVLFVSHHMPTVKQLCTRALLIRNGRLEADGAPDAIVAEYLQEVQPPVVGGVIPADRPRIGTGAVRLRTIRTGTDREEDVQQVFLGQPLRVTLEFEALQQVPDALVEIGLSTTDGLRVVTAHNTDGDGAFIELGVGVTEIVVDLDVTLLPREYVIDVGISRSSGLTLDWVEGVAQITALNTSREGGDHYRPGQVRGFVRPATRWHVSTLAR